VVGGKSAERNLNSIDRQMDKIKTNVDSIYRTWKDIANVDLAKGYIAPNPQRRQEGGPIYHAKTGKYFPGYGGGDQIDIKGEAGEYMLRKEAVREASPATAASFNQGDWGAVIDDLLPKLKTGGSVGFSGPTPGYSDGGGVGEVASAGSVRNYHIPGESEPISVRADDRQAQRMLKALERKFKRRS